MLGFEIGQGLVRFWFTGRLRENICKRERDVYRVIEV